MHENSSSSDGRSDASIAPKNVPATYEFTQFDNAIFAELSSSMYFVGSALAVGGIFVALTNLAQLPGNKPLVTVLELFMGICMFIIGIWTRGAARSMKQIVTTQGNDIELLIHAMIDLKKVYRLQKVIMLFALIPICLSLIFIIINLVNRLFE